MDFIELQDYLENRMKMMHIYQPTMIRILLGSKNVATVEDIARAFLQNDSSQIDYYMEITKNMPGKVLRKNNVVEYKEGKFILTSPQFTDKQREILMQICNKKISEYEKKFGEKIWIHRGLDTRHISGSLQYDVFAKAKGRCMACGISRQKRALDVDHIIPRNKGGKTEISNLQALCYKCNSQKRDRDDTDFGKWEETMMHRNSKCVFCTGKKYFLENELAYAVFDKYPVTKSHTLIIPKRHIDTFFDLLPAEKNQCLQLINLVKEKLVQKDKTISGFNVGINVGTDAGQTIPHCHIHLIPRRKNDTIEPQGGIRNIIPGKGKY